ncbi:MAG TPA: excinuclease ABC subunit UvrC [Planctomycetes bacterium]|nr:excinuclease ABC subunit UvrC [Planctomycetota bacterium]
MHPKVQEKAGRLPDSPGCYLFKDARGKVLYVGKAGSLRKRVASYLRPGGDGRISIRFLESEARDLDFVVTNTAQEALLLENTLIKKFRPKHNLKLKDDKAYLMLRIDLSEPWPWFRFVRRRRSDKARYIGPFASAGAIRRTLRILHRVTPMRDCSDGVFQGRSRPCLKAQIGRCPAPCVGEISREDYMELVHRAIRILEGRSDDLVRDLQERMAKAAEELRFEEAATCKEHLKALALITERQRVDDGRADRDVLGLHALGTRTLLVHFLYREGKLEGSKLHEFETQLPPSEVLHNFLLRAFAGDRYVPREILLPFEVPELADVQAWLQAKRGRRVDLVVPKRGDRRRVVELASENARLCLEAGGSAQDRARRELDEVAALLGLPSGLRRIHCLDVSTTQGRDTVASRVCFEDGAPKRGGYRRFKIRGAAGREDFASMAQAVARSLRLCLEREDEDLPDLLLIDGGKGQLSSALQGVAECGLDPSDLPVVGIAKDKERGGRRTGERLFLPGRPEPIPLEPGSPPFLLLTRVRDEAHRFAITFHRKLRSSLTSELDTIPGIGPKRRKALLRHFGSLANLRRASLQELQSSGCLPPALAATLYESLKRNPQ